jgi:Flp pilus assembly protein TadG
MGRVRHLYRDRAGNVAVAFALVATLLIIAAGAAIDFTNFMARKTQVQDAADAASVGSVSTNSAGYQAGVAMTSDGPISASDNPSTAIFNANKPTSPDLSNVQISAQMARSGTTISDAVSVSGVFNTTFLQMVGIKTLQINVASNASATTPPYVNFYMLLDNSPSMGLGATTSDITALYNATGCGFSCHTTNDPSEDYYAVAKTLGVNMRIDVVRQATNNLMQTANATANTNNSPTEFQVDVFDFGTAAYTSPALNNVTAGLGSNGGSLVSTQVAANQGNALTTAINSIDLETVPSNNYAYQTPVAQGSVSNNDEDTNFNYMLTQLASIIGTGGNGAAPATPQKVLFFVTDGMVDMNNNGSRQMGGLNTSYCTTLKNQGVTIAILYTTYLPSSINTDPWSETNAVPLLPQIAPALQACASPGLYYAVSPSDGISEAMSALFSKVLAVVRVTS